MIMFCWEEVIALSILDFIENMLFRSNKNPNIFKYDQWKSAKMLQRITSIQHLDLSNISFYIFPFETLKHQLF